MKIVSPSFELLPPHGTAQMDVLQRIERCGRICYKSEAKITDDSCVKFVGGIISRGHEAVLEHATLIFLLDFRTWSVMQEQIAQMEQHDRYVYESFLRFTNDVSRPIVSGNIRAWRDYLKACRAVYGHVPPFADVIVYKYPVLFPEFQGIPNCSRSRKYTIEQLAVGDLYTINEKLTHYDRTVIFTCDRGISHEIVRHRPASYCQESTRYCNYSKEGFGGEITVIEPSYLEPGTAPYRLWKVACDFAESQYFALLNVGLYPQEARGVLPTCLKTEVCMTTYLSEWRHFLSLRGSMAAHPQIRELALPLCGDLTIAHGDVFGGVASELGL